MTVTLAEAVLEHSLPDEPQRMVTLCEPVLAGVTVADVEVLYPLPKLYCQPEAQLPPVGEAFKVTLLPLHIEDGFAVSVSELGASHPPQVIFAPEPERLARLNPTNFSPT